MLGITTKKLLATVSSIAMLTALANTALAQAPKFYISNKDNAKISEIADWSMYEKEGDAAATEAISNGSNLYLGGAHNIKLDYARTVDVDLLQHDGVTLTVTNSAELTSVMSTDGSKVGEVGSDARTDALAAVGADVDAKASIVFAGDNYLEFLYDAEAFEAISEVDLNNHKGAELVFGEPFSSADGKLGDFAADIKSSGDSAGKIVVSPGAKVRFTGQFGEDNTGGGGDDERVKELVLSEGVFNPNFFAPAAEFSTEVSFANDVDISGGITIGAGAALRLEPAVNLKAATIKSLDFDFGLGGALILEGNNTLDAQIGMVSFKDALSDKGFVSPISQVRVKGDVTFNGPVFSFATVVDTNNSTVELNHDYISLFYMNVNGGSGTFKFNADDKTMYLAMGIPEQKHDVGIDFNDKDSTLAFLGFGNIFGEMKSTGGDNGTILVKHGDVQLHSTFDDAEKVGTLKIVTGGVTLDNNLYLGKHLIMKRSQITFNEDVDTVDVGGKFKIIGNQASTVVVKGDLVLPTIHTEHDDTLRLQMSGVDGKLMEVTQIKGSTALKSVIVDGGGKLKLPIKTGKIDTINNLRFDEDGGELYLYHDAANKEDQIDLTLKAKRPFRSENAKLTFGAAKNKTKIFITGDSSINNTVFDQIHLDDKLTLSLAPGVNLATRNGIIDSATNAKLELPGDNTIRGKVDTDVLLAGDGTKIYGNVTLQNKFALINDDSAVLVQGHLDSKLVFMNRNHNMTIDGGYTGVINNYSAGGVAPSSTLTFAGNGNVAIDRMNKAGGANFEELYFVGGGNVIFPDTTDVAAEKVYVAGKKNIYWGQANQCQSSRFSFDPRYKGEMFIKNKQEFTYNLGNKYNPMVINLTSKNAKLKLDEVVDDVHGIGNNYFVKISDSSGKAEVVFGNTNVKGDIGTAPRPVGKVLFDHNTTFNGDIYAYNTVQADDTKVKLRASNVHGVYHLGTDSQILMKNATVGSVFASNSGRISCQGQNKINSIGKVGHHLQSLYVQDRSSLRVSGDLYVDNVTVYGGGRIGVDRNAYIHQLTMNSGSELNVDRYHVTLGDLEVYGNVAISMVAQDSNNHGQITLDAEKLTFNSGGTINVLVFTDDGVATYSNMKLFNITNTTESGAQQIIESMNVNALGRNVELQSDNTYTITGFQSNDRVRRVVEDTTDAEVAVETQAAEIAETVLADIVKDKKIMINIDRKVAELEKVREASVEKQKEFVQRLATAMTEPTSAVAGGSAVSNASTSIVGDILASRMGGQAMPISFSSSSSAGLSATPAAAAAAAGDESVKYGAWVKAIGGTSRQNITRNVSSGYRGSLVGGVLGFDAELNEQQSLGLALGHVYGQTKMRDTQAGDRIKNRTNLISLYGQHQFNDRWFINASTSYAITNVSSFAKRVISQNDYDTAVGEYKVKSFSASIMSGYNFMPHDNLVLTPLLGVKFTNTKQDRYSEVGAAGQNMTVNVKHKNNVTAVTGMSLATRVDAWGLDLAPELHTMLNYKMGSKYSSTAKVGFVGDDDTVFSQIETPSRFTGSIGGGISFQHKMMEYSVGYDAQFGKKYIGHQGSLRVKINL